MTSWFRRRRRDEDLDDEIRAHLAMAARERMARGETAADAAAGARREFGNVLLLKEVTRAMWSGARTSAGRRPAHRPANAQPDPCLHRRRRALRRGRNRGYRDDLQRH
jgi:hypothetical protein